MLSVALLVGMGDEATKEAFEWAIGCTDAVMAGSVVARFVNDMTSFKVYICSLDCGTIYVSLDYIQTFFN